MGLFSHFRNKDNKNHVPMASPSSPSANMTLATSIERCIYANAKFIGAVAMYVHTRSQEGSHPNFIMFLNQILEILPENLHRLLTTDAGREATFLRPEEYRDFFGEGSERDWSQYISDCGVVAYVQELYKQGETIRKKHGQNQIPVNIPTQLDSLKSSSQMAIAQCLSLLKAAQKQNDSSIKSILLDDSSYLFALVYFYLGLQVNLFHMLYQNGVVFIPDHLLNGPIEISLNFVETGINPDAPVVAFPFPLASIMYIPNEDNNVALGHFPLAGIEGVIVRTDQSCEEYIETLADNFVAGLEAATAEKLY